MVPSMGSDGTSEIFRDRVDIAYAGDRLGLAYSTNVLFYTHKPMILFIKFIIYSTTIARNAPAPRRVGELQNGGQYD